MKDIPKSYFKFRYGEREYRGILKMPLGEINLLGIYENEIEPTPILYYSLIDWKQFEVIK